MKPPPRPRRAPSASPGMLPRGASAPSRGSCAWDAGSGAYVFRTDSAAYRVVVGPPGERSGLLRVEGRLEGGEGEQAWQPLLRSAGMLAREGEEAVLQARATRAGGELLELAHSPRGRGAELRYTELLAGQPVGRTLQFRLMGRALEVRVDAPGGLPEEGYSGFTLGPVGPDDARPVAIPGLPDPLVVLPEGGFAGAYADRQLGRATSYPEAAALYQPVTDGRSSPISEVFYLTLSRDPLDPLPSLVRPVPPHRTALEYRVTLDLLSDAPFAEDEALIRLLTRYGLHDVLLIYRDWQQYGYGRRAPLMYPANPDRGGSDALRRLVDAATDAGWRVALREEYVAITPDSPYWTEKALAYGPDGQPRLSPRPGACAVAADRMLDFARLESTHIQRNYRPTAVFVDGHTALSPGWGFRQVDATPGSRCGSEAEAARHLEGLLFFLREAHEAPVIGSAGEGDARFDTFAVGMAEAVLRGPEGGADAPLIVDYELGEVRPRLLGIGAGSYRQFCGLAADETVEPSRVDWDAYRATEIALGHGGYAGTYRITPGARGPRFPGGGARNTVREYYLLRALGELHSGAPLESVAYYDGKGLVDLATALRQGLDLTQARLRIEYGNGLTVWVNRTRTERWSVQAEGLRYELPPSGFLAVAPEQRFLAYSANVGGNRADFCECEGYVFLDTRSANPRGVENIVVDGAVVLLGSAVSGRNDLVMVEARQLTLEEGEYRLSERADLRLTHLSPEEVELTVLDSDNGKPVHVSWPAFSPEWTGPGLEVWELQEGEWQASRCTVQQIRTGPQLARARPGVTYRVRVPEG